MLRYITETVTVSRLQNTTGIRKELVSILENIEIDIQPNVPEAFGSDLVYEGFKGFVSTSDKNLIRVNDQLTSDLDGTIYFVKSSQFYQGNGRLDDSLELLLSTSNNN